MKCDENMEVPSSFTLPCIIRLTARVNLHVMFEELSFHSSDSSGIRIMIASKGIAYALCYFEYSKTRGNLE